MRRNRKIRKEDIGGPSNFVHVQHVGFGQKKSSLASIHGQRSLDLGGGESEREVESESSSPAIVTDQEEFPSVERRTRGSRSSLVPRHHRSTTTCIFPDSGYPNHNLENHLSIPTSARHSRGGSRDPISPEKNGSNLKPTFGSLLNLSFLPLGLGKSSSKSPSVGKTKRMSLLNLTASNLFAGQKVPGEAEGKKKEAVKMTGYTRRRSFSNTRGEDDTGEKGGNGTLKKQIKESREKDNGTPLSAKENDTVTGAETPPPVVAPTTSARIPLAKLGRSKSTMAEFTKRPKLRLKIVPPVVPPPPVPVSSSNINIKGEGEGLPSPPPSPLPSPPKTPTSAPPIPPPPLSLEDEELLAVAQVVKRRVPKSPPRSRIIPLPSTPSLDSLDPVSPQYLTPIGGSSPMPETSGRDGESAFPLLSPTIPQNSTPFYAAIRRNPGTPPVWPLQPVWPSSLAILQKEPTIPEVPSPSKEEMDVVESEYDPVALLVDSFISEGQEARRGNHLGSTSTAGPRMFNEMVNSITVCPNNLKLINSVLRESLPDSALPNITTKLFSSTQALLANDQDKFSDRASRINRIQEEILAKTLELWMEVTDGQASVEELAKLVDEENQQAADSLRKICLSDN